MSEVPLYAECVARCAHMLVAEMVAFGLLGLKWRCWYKICAEFTQQRALSTQLQWFLAHE